MPCSFNVVLFGQGLILVSVARGKPIAVGQTLCWLPTIYSKKHSFFCSRPIQPFWLFSPFHCHAFKTFPLSCNRIPCFLLSYSASFLSFLRGYHYLLNKPSNPVTWQFHQRELLKRLHPFPHHVTCQSTFPTIRVPLTIKRMCWTAILSASNWWPQGSTVWLGRRKREWGRAFS